ncbi:prenyltransferase [Aureococcus anophagefferens]|nr:prenyltransferase [Aureococcus anophagefferens]
MAALSESASPEAAASPEAVFHDEKHASYLVAVSKNTEAIEFVLTEYMRMSGVYWGLTAMALLGRDVHKEMDGDAVVAWVLRCQHPCGGFGGGEGHDPHLLYTLSAADFGAPRRRQMRRAKAAAYVAALQQGDGSFHGDEWGEVDTRFSYCALSSLAILGELWNCDSGGLNGRPEKQADVCYSWWILSSLTILGRSHWIDEAKLAAFILECQEGDGGGVADRPGNMADVFHTFFGIGGLSLLSWFDGTAYAGRPAIDPTWARARDEAKATPPPSP